MCNLTRTLAVLATVALLATVGSSGCTRNVSSDPPAQLAVVESLRKTAAGSATAKSADAGGGGGGTGWATLKGRFVFDGSATAAPLDVNKDQAVCNVPLFDESLVVSSNKGLANVVVFLRSKNRIHEDVNKAAMSASLVYDNKLCRFEPHVLAVPVNTKVVIRNSDAVGHNSNGSPPGDVPFNPLIPAGGGVYEHTFKKAQLKGVPVTCSIHPWMKGFILPRDNPYFAVSDKEGAFEIKNLPAGEEIEIQLWHEKADNGLEVDSKWPKGRQKLKLTADGVLDLGELKVSAAVLK